MRQLSFVGLVGAVGLRAHTELWRLLACMGLLGLVGLVVVRLVGFIEFVVVIGFVGSIVNVELRGFKGPPVFVGFTEYVWLIELGGLGDLLALLQLALLVGCLRHLGLRLRLRLRLLIVKRGQDALY